MDGQRRFAVIGTDPRLAAAGRSLARAGFAVGGPEQTALADYILLPLPLPLGGIAARRSLPDEVRHEAERLLRTSIEYAFTHPEASRTYIKQHAQELDDKVIDAHIALFVNGYSLSLGDEGRRAVEALTGVIP